MTVYKELCFTMSGNVWVSLILDDLVDPTRFHEVFPWANSMIGCPHDPLHHAEGDPWTHTKMVVEELVASAAYQALPHNRRGILRLAAWLHDIAKPATTVIEWDEAEQRERVRQPKHSVYGAQWAYNALLDARLPMSDIRDVVALVRWHQRPLFIHDTDAHSAQRRIIEFSLEAGRGNWDELMILCRADQRGRTSPNKQQSLEALDYMEMLIESENMNIGVDLKKQPWPFPNDLSRLTYLRNSGTSPFGELYDLEYPQMILMSGLPGSGKDTFIRERFHGLPTVCLDDLRAEHGVSWEDNQGSIVQLAYEAAREHFRRGETFVWNATSISRFARQKICTLARDYSVEVHAYSIDVPLPEVQRRNAARDLRAVPRKMIDRYAEKREAIMMDEVHSLTSVNQLGEQTLIFGKGRARRSNPSLSLKADA
jgi:predicted kinase